MTIDFVGGKGHGIPAEEWGFGIVRRRGGDIDGLEEAEPPRIGAERTHV
jgi:hypothetical protein